VPSPATPAEAPQGGLPKPVANRISRGRNVTGATPAPEPESEPDAGKVPDSGQNKPAGTDANRPAEAAPTKPAEPEPKKPADAEPSSPPVVDLQPLPKDPKAPQ
jgi:hypothetical protein